MYLVEKVSVIHLRQLNYLICFMAREHLALVQLYELTNSQILIDLDSPILKAPS